MRQKYRAPLVVALLLLLACGGLWVYQVRHAAAWPAVYRTRFSKHFKLPPQAVILDYRCEDPFWSKHDEATFTLPENRSPRQWLQWIASHSHLGTRSPSGLRYDGAEPCVEEYYVRYIPGEDVYEAVWDWEF